MRRLLRSNHAYGLWAASAVTAAASALCLGHPRLSCEPLRDDPQSNQSSSKQAPSTASASFNKTWASFKATLTPTAALEFQDKLEEWNKSLDDVLTLSQRLYSELSFADDSLARHIVDNDRKDAELHPELRWHAHVRLGKEPCFLERAFARLRQRRIKAAYSQLLGVPQNDIDLRDIPTFGIAASGGGYRALVNTTGSLHACQSTGLLDFVHYIAGISGSCWSLSALYSLANGQTSFLREHIKSRIRQDFLNPDTLELLINDPPARYLLSGALIKQAVGDLNLADVYGTLVSSRILLPDNCSNLSFSHLRLSSQQSLLEDARLPLPIYSMVRHDVTDADEDVHGPDPDRTSHSDAHGQALQAAESSEQQARQKRGLMSAATWQWFELTPYEVGSPDIEAWIPSWALGRHFRDGRSLQPQPELSMTVMNGIFASAFSATLLHYWKEMAPLLKTVNLFGQLQPLIKDYQDSMSAIHPFPPALLPNFVRGVKGLGPNAPENMADLDTLGFMDAGAWLNLPYVPLFRRECDIILALDASADSQDLWFARAEEYAEQLQMRTWPRIEYKTLFKESFAQQPDDPLAEAKEQQKQAAASSGNDNPYADAQHLQRSSTQGTETLEDVNIWIGNSAMPSGSAKISSKDLPKLRQAAEDRDGMALVYLRLRSEELLNVWSTWRFEYPPEETEKLYQAAENKIRASDEAMRAVLKGIYERKRAARLLQEGKPLRGQA